jgi:diguanylate cyclase (GGDEF)-like protein
VKIISEVQHLTSRVLELENEIANTKDLLKLYAAVVENFPGGIILTDKNLNVVVCNEQQKKLLNYSPELFDNHTPSLYELFQYNAGRGEYGPGRADLLVAEKIDLVKKRIAHVFERIRPDGTVIEVRGEPIEGGGFVTTYIDITERRKSEEFIYNMAFNDGLTKLANRTGLTRSLENFSARAQRGEHFAVLYVDLDDFKPINDTHGHAVGDLVLQETARRLKSNCREVDIVSRYGGDEFVILQASIEKFDDVEVLARRLTKALSQPFCFGDTSVSISCSIGAVCSNALSKESNVNSLISMADKIMYKSKAAGKGVYFIHERDKRNTALN